MKLGFFFCTGLISLNRFDYLVHLEKQAGLVVLETIVAARPLAGVQPDFEDARLVCVGLKAVAALDVSISVVVC